jgi:hypothetical protein
MTPVALYFITILSSYQSTMKVTELPSSLPLTADAKAGATETILAVERAWNTHDMDLYATLIDEHCQWVNVVGMWWNGKSQVVRAHAAFHQSIFKNVSFTGQEASLRALGPDLVQAVYTMKMGEYSTPDGKKIPSQLNRQTLVLKRHGGKWLILSGQNTVIDSIAAQFDPGRG